MTTQPFVVTASRVAGLLRTAAALTACSDDADGPLGEGRPDAGAAEPSLADAGPEVPGVADAGQSDVGGNLPDASTPRVRSFYHRFVASFTPDGTHRFSRRFGASDEDDRVNAVAVDPRGNIVITGAYQGTIDFGGGPLVSAGRTDIFLASFDPQGGHRFSKRFGGPGFDSGAGLRRFRGLWGGPWLRCGLGGRGRIVYLRRRRVLSPPASPSFERVPPCPKTSDP